MIAWANALASGCQMPQAWIGGRHVRKTLEEYGNPKELVMRVSHLDDLVSRNIVNGGWEAYRMLMLKVDEMTEHAD